MKISNMVAVPSLNADIVPGDYLMAVRASENNARVLSVCKVKTILSPNKFEVTWWVVACSGDVPPLCTTRFSTLGRCKITELIEDSSLVKLPVEDVTDLAFVFHTETLETLYHPFSRFLEESYPSCIWFTLFLLQQKTRKLMSFKRQQRICQRLESTSFPLEGWRYLCHSFWGFTILYTYERRHTKSHQLWDLSLYSKSTLKSFAMIRIANSHSIIRAR